jgi:CheY-like chemotaxis protein
VLYLDPLHREALLHLALLSEGEGDKGMAERLRGRARRAAKEAGEWPSCLHRVIVAVPFESAMPPWLNSRRTGKWIAREKLTSPWQTGKEEHCDSTSLVSSCPTIGSRLRPKQLLEALRHAFDPQRTSMRKASSTSAFDPNLGSRFPLRILVADDNRVNQRVGQALLEKLGYRAEVVSNGLEVLHALELHSYDIVFLDVQMPEMDGLSAAREIRRRWSEEDRPRIIAMTAEAMLGDRERCLEAGMDDYVAKPIRIVDLRAALERCGREVFPPQVDM